MKLRLRNGTRYDDAELLEVLRPIVEHLERQKGPRYRGPRAASWRQRVVEVHVVYTRWTDPGPHRLPNAELGEIIGAGYSGSAYLLGTRSTLRVPRESLDVECLAALWLHEAWHLWGARHPDYPPAVYRCALRTVAGLVPARVLVERAAEPAPRLSDAEKAERRAERQREAIERLLERRQAWARKLSRAETAIRKIDRSLTGYRSRGALPAEAEIPARRRARKG